MNKVIEYLSIYSTYSRYEFGDSFWAYLGREAYMEQDSVVGQVLDEIERPIKGIVEDTVRWKIRQEVDNANSY